MGGFHARLSPSSSSRWSACPASVRLTADIQGTTNPAAELGTAVHEVGEVCLLTNVDAKTLIGMEFNHHITNEKMADDAQMYVDYVRSHMTETSELFVECKLDLTMVAPDTFGHSDAIIVDHTVLHVFDYKNGRGHVSPVDNSQGKLYALGAYHEHSMFYDFEKVVIHIVQPNSSQGGHSSSWEISADDLLDFGDWIVGRAKLALSEDSKCVAGETQCQWCDYSSQCKALKEYTEDLLMGDMENLEDVDPDAVSLEEVAELLLHKKMIADLLTKYEDRILEAMEHGEEVTGFKLVKKQVRKRWVNEIEAYEKLINWFKQDEFTTRKLSTPTQVEKLLGAKVSTRKANVFKTLWELPEAQNTVAPLSDRRKPVEPTFTEI